MNKQVAEREQDRAAFRMLLAIIARRFRKAGLPRKTAPRIRHL